jgi:hypothetical protein
VPPGPPGAPQRPLPPQEDATIPGRASAAIRGIGIARLGNSADDLCITPEEPAALPIDCDAQGTPLRSPDGELELRVQRFKDESGWIKRQAARFRVYVYDEESPGGRPLRLGDPVQGGGITASWSIQWRVHVASKKTVCYDFRQYEGEHGHAPDDLATMRRSRSRGSPSNFPHNQSSRGNFDPARLGTPPMFHHEALARCEDTSVEDHENGDRPLHGTRKYEGHIRARSAYCEAERRWPDSPFWQRRSPPQPSPD